MEVVYAVGDLKVAGRGGETLLMDVEIDACAVAGGKYIEGCKALIVCDFIAGSASEVVVERRDAQEPCRGPIWQTRR